jgi:hypothetical protein
MVNINESRIRRIETLVGKVESIADPADRKDAQELMALILELHGAGIERMFELLSESGIAGETLINHLASDPLVSSILILHNLHPEDLATRVRSALQRVRGVELIDISDGVVRAMVTGHGTTRQGALDLIRGAAPDAVDIIVEEQGVANGFVPLASLTAVR